MVDGTSLSADSEWPMHILRFISASEAKAVGSPGIGEAAADEEAAAAEEEAVELEGAGQDVDAVAEEAANGVVGGERGVAAGAGATH